MADNDRWRSDQERYGQRDDARERWRGEGRSPDYGRGGRSGEYRGGGYGGEDWRGDERGGYRRDQGSDEGFIAQRGFGNERAGYDRASGRGGRYGEERGGYGGDYDQGGRYGGYQGGGSRGGGYWSGDYGRDFRDEYRRDFGQGRGGSYGSDYRGGGYGYEGGAGRYGRESYGRGSGEYGRQGEERGFWDRASDEVSSWFGDEDADRRRRMDEMRGEHRGRGPKSYTRSDDRIREDVCDRLTDDPQVDASEVEVKVSNCEVTLSGTVSSREAKRRAEDCAERVSGVKHVQNNLRVQSQSTIGAGPAHTTGAGTTTGTQAASSTATTGGRQKA